MRYKLTQEAEDDLIRIYRFGFHRFGEVQADRYFELLHGCFDRISKAPDQFPQADRVREGYRFCVCGSDTIYFRLNEKAVVEIVRIIGVQNF